MPAEGAHHRVQPSLPRRKALGKRETVSSGPPAIAVLSERRRTPKRRPRDACTKATSSSSRRQGPCTVVSAVPQGVARPGGGASPGAWDLRGPEPGDRTPPPSSAGRGVWRLHSNEGVPRGPGGSGRGRLGPWDRMERGAQCIRPSPANAPMMWHRVTTGAAGGGGGRGWTALKRSKKRRGTGQWDTTAAEHDL